MTPKPRPAFAKLALAVSAALLASGCAGSAVPAGTAAQIGSRSLSNAEVDHLTTALCEAEGPKMKQSSRAYPMSTLRSIVVRAMATKAIVAEIADEYGIKPGETYQRQVATWRLTAQGLNLPQELRDGYVTLQSSIAYKDDILSQAADQKLAEAGVEDPTVDDLQAAGDDLLKTWSATHRLAFDPRYGLTVRDGVIAPADTAVSVAVSRFAKDAANTEADPTQLASVLPANLVCGD